MKQQLKTPTARRRLFLNLPGIKQQLKTPNSQAQTMFEPAGKE